jgi:hypothetical protein
MTIARVFDFPAAGQRAGQGRSPAPQTSGGVGDQQPYTKRGRDVAVGDQVRNCSESFLVVGFTGEVRRAGDGRLARVAFNVWGDELAIDNSNLHVVLNPPNSATTHPK